MEARCPECYAVLFDGDGDSHDCSTPAPVNASEGLPEYVEEALTEACDFGNRIFRQDLRAAILRYGDERAASWKDLCDEVNKERGDLLREKFTRAAQPDEVVAWRALAEEGVELIEGIAGPDGLCTWAKDYVAKARRALARARPGTAAGEVAK